MFSSGQGHCGIRIISDGRSALVSRTVMNHEIAVSNAKEIADRILAPAAKQNDKEARFSSEAVAALGPAGWLGIMLPTELCGSALVPPPFPPVVPDRAEADA